MVRVSPTAAGRTVTGSPFERRDRCMRFDNQISGSTAKTWAPKAAAAKANNPTLAPMSQTTMPGRTSSARHGKQIGIDAPEVTLPERQGRIRGDKYRDATERLWKASLQDSPSAQAFQEFPEH